MNTARVRDLYLQQGDILLMQGGGVARSLVVNGDTSRWSRVGVVLNGGQMYEAGSGATHLADHGNRLGTVVRNYQAPCHGRPNEYELRPLSPHRTAARRHDIVGTARRLDPLASNRRTLACLAAYRAGIRSARLRRCFQRDEYMTGAQAADLVYSLCSLVLFADGREPYDVTPGDLARLA